MANIDDELNNYKAPFSKQRRSLLSSQARVQAPWVSVKIGDYTFGVKTNKRRSTEKFETSGLFPDYVTKLVVQKINGQVNQYTLSISYPITQDDDPNFFEKVFSSVSATRKIVFSYGDATVPSFVYKEEEAIITKIQQTFSLEASRIDYTVSAVSGAALASSGNFSFPGTGTTDPNKKVRPSAKIRELWDLRDTYHLQDLFTGMAGLNDTEWYELVASDDEPVYLDTKNNISVLSYITYLVSCMIPAGTVYGDNLTNDIYILTIHDSSSYDRVYNSPNSPEQSKQLNGPYFKVTKASSLTASGQSDAYEIDIGYNTSTIVTQFAIDQNENYSIYYDYNNELYPKSYVRRLNADGKWEDDYAPTCITNGKYQPMPEDKTWWTKITKYPIGASLTIQGLLRPAMLMTHVRLNVIFPGGHKHIASGLYLITKQIDTIDGNGYKTQLTMTKIMGDNYQNTNVANGYW